MFFLVPVAMITMTLAIFYDICTDVKRVRIIEQHCDKRPIECDYKRQIDDIYRQEIKNISKQLKK